MTSDDDAIACMKCGSVDGWDGPKYHGTRYFCGDGYVTGREVLGFTCRICGYERDEPTKDATAPPPPSADKDPGWILVPTRPVENDPPWWAFWR